MIPRTEGFLHTSDGERIWYETAGEGPDLVLSHGLGGNAAVWYQQLPYFAQHHRVITWDQRGFGRSTNTTESAGPEAAISDLIALMDLLNVTSTDLVGQSMGGWVVLGVALQQPERVKSVVLACTTAGIPVGFGPAIDPPLTAPVKITRPLGEHPAVGGRLQSLDMARAYLYQALGSFGNRPSDSDFFRILRDFTFSAEELGELTVPVLMIAGELDSLMTPERIRAAATYFPDARVLELPDRGHSPYFEDPDPWNAHVHSFHTAVSGPDFITKE